MIPPPVRVAARSPLQYAFVIGNVFDHVESEIEDSCGRYLARIHLHELDFGRQTLSRVHEARGMQFGADQAFPVPRLGHGAQYEAGAAADFQKLSRAREEFIRQPDNQRVARHKPEVLGLQFSERRKACGIRAAGGIGKLGREQ
jgi:hypothetical protein